MSGSKNKINMAIQAATVDDLFNKLCFVNEIGAQFLSHLREEVGTHTVQGTVAVIHGDVGV